MTKETKRLFIVEGIILLIVLTIGIGYAFLSTSGKQELANTFTAGCLSITIEEEGRAIDLENAYPITDIEGLEQDGYTFKIKNNCSNDTNYQINLESLSNPTADTTLKADYVRVSLSSDTMDNLITTLKENDVATYHSENAYVSYNLYSGILKGSASKSFTLKEWVEYNTTKEEGASKEYKSQINVVSDTRVEVTPKPEITFAYSGNTIKGTIAGSATDITYCETKDNRCEPKQNGEIQEQTTSITLNEESKTKEVTTKLGVLNVYQDYKRMICAKLDNGKTICSNPDTGSGTPDFSINSDYADNDFKVCTYKGISVNTGYAPEEMCQLVFEITRNGSYYYQDGLMEYELRISSDSKRVGLAIWDEEKQICTYNGNEIKTWGEQRINQENCLFAYEQNGKYITFNLIDEMKETYNADNINFLGAGTLSTAVGKTGIYETKDEEGTSYYYRGAVENNYVEFAGFYWRIIRINGNGSIRLIYSGKKDEVNEIGKETILKNGYKDTNGYKMITLKDERKYGTYNGDVNDNAYVGYMYGTPGSNNYTDAHENINESNVKKELDNWYIANLKQVEDKLDTQAGFCNDRSLAEGYENVGYGTKETYYGASDRIKNKYQPTLKCVNKDNDYFTWKGHANTGNKVLTNPIGLITADEAMYAGANTVPNDTYYLYTGQNYWTMSPYDFNGSYAGVFCVSSFGYLGYYYVDSTNIGVRPVVNVDPNKVSISGTGTIDNPYLFS